MKKTIFFLLLFVLCLKNLQANTRGIEKVEIKNTSGEIVGLYEESHALVIGASNYENWRKLPGVQNDVYNVTAALQQQGFKVETINDPDQNGLDGAFEDFIDTHGGHPENRLLFYFAGHGNTVKPKYGGEPMGYIVPIDAPDPTLGYVQERLFKRMAISMHRIEEYALDIDAKHALFIFDACFSGSLFALSRGAVHPKSISYKTNGFVRQFITSGRADELVPDKSIFSEQFVYALQGAADVNSDGYISGTELGIFLQDTVINYSKDAQHPQYGKIRNPLLDKGDFIFTILKAESKNDSKELLSVTPSDPEKNKFKEDEEWWSMIRGSEEEVDFRSFLEEFPTSRLARVARLKLRKLKREGLDKKEQEKLENEQKLLEKELKSGGAEEKSEKLASNSLALLLENKGPKRVNGVNQGVLFKSLMDDVWKKTGDEKKDYKYVGESINGVPNGIGTETSPTGTRYEGEWKDGMPNGQGTAIYGKGKNEGDIYVGGFKNGKYNFYGRYNYSDGRTFEGEYKDGKEHGLGSFTWTNGDKYVGGYKDGKEQGMGTFIWADGKKYEGEFKEGSASGKGTSIYPNGDKYVGAFEKGSEHGRGTMFFAMGGRYTGWYKNGLKHGKGKTTSTDGKVYEGEYRVGNATGIGTITWTNGDKYEGEVKNGEIVGQGTFYSLDGDMYTGEYKDGKINGHGKYTRQDGRIYEGAYKDGLKHGQGKFTWPDGDMYTGEFADDLINGGGKYIWSNGDMYVGEWKDNKKHGEGTYYQAGENGAIDVGQMREGDTWNATRYNKNGTILGKFVDGVYIKE